MHILLSFTESYDLKLSVEYSDVMIYSVNPNQLNMFLGSLAGARSVLIGACAVFRINSLSRVSLHGGYELC